METQLDGVAQAQPPESDFVRVGVRVIGRVLAVMVNLRDVYYGSIDELERAVCAS